MNGRLCDASIAGRAGGGNAAPPAPEGEFRILRAAVPLYARDNREGAMGYKTILVHCDAGRGTADAPQDRPRSGPALRCARDRLHVRQAFQAPAFTDAGPAMDSLYKTYETVVKADEAIATAAFREAVGSKGVSSEWRVADGYVDEVVRAEARTADLVDRRPGRSGPAADGDAGRPGGRRRHGRRASGADRALYRRGQAAGQDGDAVLEREPRSEAGGERRAAAAQDRRQGDRADHRPQDTAPAAKSRESTSPHGSPVMA